MTKSASTSRRNDLPRKRVLARGANVHTIGDEDVRWIYAAYRMGTFDGPVGYLADAPKGMRRTEFEKWLGMSLVEVGEGKTSILTSPWEGEDRPVGIIIGKLSDHRLYPSVWWFPWASPRNKLECVVKFLNTMRATNLVLITVEKSDWGFYNHLLRYGMMKMCGKIEDYFDSNKTAKLYQTRGFAGVA